MRQIRRILVAVKDPAARTQPAVTKAAQLARALRAELLLFQAIPEPAWLPATALLNGGLADAERVVRERSRARLEALARRLRRSNLRVTVSVSWGAPIYAAIGREARRARTDLVVSGQHGAGHRGAALLQLTDWELLRWCPLPLLLVKRAGVYRRPAVLAAVDPERAFGKPAQLDAAIVRAGVALAGALHGRLHGVHAYSPLPAATWSSGALSTEELAALQLRAAAAAAAKLRHAVRGRRIPRNRLHLVARHPADAIEQVAAQTRCAIVVMGALSRSGLKNVLVGNTAEKVLDALRCDLLVVKPPGFARQLVPVRRRVR